jgi:hypothetical protein
VSIALATQFSCGGGEKASPDRGLASPEIHRGGFIVRVFSMEPDHDGVFVEHLRECALPVWNELKAAGVVSKVSIFELSEIETTFPVSPPWRYLLVVGLGTEASATDFVAAEQASRCPKGSAVASYTVVREEHMVCTPNSCFGLPESAYPDAPTGIDYLIELISVKNTPASLAKYHDLMSSYIGPANGLLVERGMLHCFVALETIAAEIGKHEVVPWNQVHVSDHWDEGGDVDWEAVYEDLFRDEFSRELDEVWAEIPPIREVSSEYRGRLVTDLCVR